MATMHREQGVSLIRLAVLTLISSGPAVAQMQTTSPADTQVQAPAQTLPSAQGQAQAQAQAPLQQQPAPGQEKVQGPARTSAVQGTLNAQVYATTSSSTTPGIAGREDVILSVAPGLSVMARGANTSIEGQWQLNAVQYFHGSQPNAVLPSGQLNLHADVIPKGAGINATASSSQVRSAVTATSSDTPNTSDTYTNSLLRLSPYIDKQLDEQTHALVRLNRSILHTSRNGDDALANRPNSRLTDDIAQLSRQPTPLGYKLEWRRQESSFSGTNEPALNERRARAIALYAPTREFDFGYIIGKGRNTIDTQRIAETTHGVQLHWRPTERSELNGEVENRYFGRAWQLQASHRSPWFAFGLNTERSVSTYVSNLGALGQGGSLTGMYDALLTTRIPDPVERRKAVEDLMARRNLTGQVATAGDVYDVSAQILQSTSGRVAFMGRRDVLTFVGGIEKTAPVTSSEGSSAVALTSVARTKSYYFDTQLNHQLTPYSTLSGGLRWNRASSTAPSLNTPSSSRDFAMRAALNTSLGTDTTATMGIKRQLTRNASSETVGESAMYVGLGHRF